MYIYSESRYLGKLVVVQRWGAHLWCEWNRQSTHRCGVSQTCLWDVNVRSVKQRKINTELNFTHESIGRVVVIIRGENCSVFLVVVCFVCVTAVRLQFKNVYTSLESILAHIKNLEIRLLSFIRQFDFLLFHGCKMIICWPRRVRSHGRVASNCNSIVSLPLIHDNNDS